MNSILITGADGFLGSHLTDSCLLKNYQVFALVKPKSSITNLSHYIRNYKHQKLDFYGERIRIPTTNNRLVILECDIRNSRLIQKIIEEIKPTYLFHFAAQSLVIPSWKNPIETIETNVIGTINIFEPIRKLKFNTKIFNACSSAAYGTTTNINRALREEDPLLAIHPYGISKIAAELLAHQYYINFGIKTINLRLFNQTGSRKINDACSDFIRKIVQIELDLTESILNVGNLEPFRDYSGIKDTLKAIWLIVNKGKPGETYNICSGRKVQIRDILNKALSLSSKKIQVIEGSPDKLRRTEEDMIVGDNTKLKNLGFTITQSIDEILKEMFDFWIQYYKSMNH